MDNLFCIRIRSYAGPSSGIYIKTNMLDYDLVLLSYHSITNKEGKEEAYGVLYYEGNHEKIEVKEDKKYKEEDLIIAKVEKLEDKFRDKIENVFLEDSKEGEKLFIRGFPQKLSSGKVPFQKLDIEINELDVTEVFHQLKFDGKNGSLSNQDETHGMSGSPIFKKYKKYIRLKGMYLEIRDKNNTFGMGHFLKSEKIKECLEKYCPDYDFGISEALSHKMSELIDEIECEFLEEYPLGTQEEEKWEKRFCELKVQVVEKNNEIEEIIKRMTCGKYKLLQLLENPEELKGLTRCLLSALICENFNIEKDSFVNYSNNYFYLAPSLEPKYPKVELGKLIQFIKENPSYNEKKIFLRYMLAKTRCRECDIDEESVEAISADLTLIPNEKYEHFMRYATRKNVKIKCAGCFSDIVSTVEYEEEGKWGKNKELEEVN